MTDMDIVERLEDHEKRIAALEAVFGVMAAAPATTETGERGAAIEPAQNESSSLAPLQPDLPKEINWGTVLAAIAELAYIAEDEETEPPFQKTQLDAIKRMADLLDEEQPREMVKVIGIKLMQWNRWDAVIKHPRGTWIKSVFALCGYDDAFFARLQREIAQQKKAMPKGGLEI